MRALAARGKSHAAFDGRCIRGGGVAPPSNIGHILSRRALPARRLARLGATRDFHHGLLADADRVRLFMRTLGAEAQAEARVYLTGGATAVLHGWRAATVVVDIKIVPDVDSVFRALPSLKDRLHINVELASPDDFIPVRDGWEDRSPFVVREGRLSFHHFDLHAQALAKIERGHVQDAADVGELLKRGLVGRKRLLADFNAIEPQLYRYPAIDPPTFRRAVEAIAAGPD